MDSTTGKSGKSIQMAPGGVQEATSDPSLPGINLPPLTEVSRAAAAASGKPDRRMVSGDGRRQFKGRHCCIVAPN